MGRPSAATGALGGGGGGVLDVSLCPVMSLAPACPYGPPDSSFQEVS